MKRSLAILLAFAMVFSIMLVGCGTAPAADTKSAAPAAETKADAPKAEATKAAEPAKYDPAKNPLAIVMIVKGHPVHHIVQLGFLSKAQELGYKAEIAGTDGTAAEEAVAAGEAALAKGTKGFLVWANIPAYYPFIKKISDAGGKVATPHFPIKEGDAPGLGANLSADPFAYGQQVAKAIGEAVKGKKGTIAISQGSFNTTENAAADGFTKYMAENYKDLKVLKPVEEGFDVPTAIARAVAVIQANKDILGAFSTTGGGPQTWSGAMDQANRKDLICVGMDYTEQNIDLVKTGKIYAIVAQPLFDEAQKSVELLDKMLRGEKVTYFTPLDAPVVTKDGIDKYADYIAKVKAFNFEAVGGTQKMK